MWAVKQVSPRLFSSGEHVAFYTDGSVNMDVVESLLPSLWPTSFKSVIPNASTFMGCASQLILDFNVHNR
jgi:hypothetical protein